jgi:exonuclease SbcD
VDSVPAGLFQGADYAALGHLHGPQRIGRGGAEVRYAGSPLALSFSEMRHRKSTALVTVGRGGARVGVELVPAPVPRPLGEATGTLDRLLGREHDPVAGHWLRVTVTDPVRPDGMIQRVKARFPHALVIRHLPAGGGEASAAGDGRPGVAAAPLEVAAAFAEFAGGAAPTAAEAAALADALEAVLAAERGE